MVLNSNHINEIHRDCEKIVEYLLTVGLADSYNPMVIRHVDSNYTAIETPNRIDSTVLKNVTYSELYESQLQNHSYMVKLPDEALIQISYHFSSGELVRHRLAYLPSPDLQLFVDLHEEYLEGFPYVEVSGTQVLPVPIRIDFDNREGVPKSVDHPACHLTLGQYKHCRIPVFSPVRPIDFINFILRNFYSIPEKLHFALVGNENYRFWETILEDELVVSHIRFGA